MAEPCPSCGSVTEIPGKYCTHCGSRLEDPSAEEYRPSDGLGYPTVMAPPYGQPFQMYPFPYPYFYRPPITAVRTASIAGGVLMLIDGVLALMLALVLIFSYEEGVGIVLLLGFMSSVISAISIFLCRFVRLALLGPLMLVIGGISVMSIGDEGAFFIGLVGILIALLSIGLVISGFGDMRMREEFRKNPMAFQMASYGAPAAMPPPYGVGQDVVKLNLRR